MKNLNSSVQNDYEYNKDENREAIIESLPVTERSLEIAGLQTSVLEGGSGPPVVLLHGPGESCIWYSLTCAQDKKRMNALRSIMKIVGVPVISPAELEKIRKPVSLIWGRYDRANKLKIAEVASKRYDWPLFVIENAGDDPKMEQPEALLETLFQQLKPETVHST